MNLLLRPKFREGTGRTVWRQVAQLIADDEGDDELIPIVVAIAER